MLTSVITLVSANYAKNFVLHSDKKVFSYHCIFLLQEMMTIQNSFVIDKT